MGKQYLISHSHHPLVLNELAAADWKDIDHDGDGRVTREDIETHIRKFLVSGRETYDHRIQEDVDATLDKFFHDIGDTDGSITWEKFSEWNRDNTFDDFVKKALRDHI